MGKRAARSVQGEVNPGGGGMRPTLTTVVSSAEEGAEEAEEEEEECTVLSNWQGVTRSLGSIARRFIPSSGKEYDAMKCRAQMPPEQPTGISHGVLQSHRQTVGSLVGVGIRDSETMVGGRGSGNVGFVVG